MKKYKIPVVSKKSNNKRGIAKVIAEQTVTMEDGRPVKSQKWTESGSTFITYFFSVKGIEDKSKEELFNYLIAEGIKIEQTYSIGKVTCQKFLDGNKQLCWGLTIVADQSEVRNN